MPGFTRPLKDGSDILGQAPSSSDIPEAIRSMIDKYDYKWTNRKISPEVRSGTTKERVVVTGTTGALGSYLLAMLLENDRVETVWALNRKSKEDHMARQKASFEEKMLDVSLLGRAKLMMLEWDLEDARLGLKEDVYQEVSSKAYGRKARADSWACRFKRVLPQLFMYVSLMMCMHQTNRSTERMANQL